MTTVSNIYGDVVISSLYCVSPDIFGLMIEKMGAKNILKYLLNIKIGSIIDYTGDEYDEDYIEERWRIAMIKQGYKYVVHVSDIAEIVSDYINKLKIIQYTRNRGDGDELSQLSNAIWNSNEKGDIIYNLIEGYSEVSGKKTAVY